MMSTFGGLCTVWWCYAVYFFLLYFVTGILCPAMLCRQTETKNKFFNIFFLSLHNLRSTCRWLEPFQCLRLSRTVAYPPISTFNYIRKWFTVPYHVIWIYIERIFYIETNVQKIEAKNIPLMIPKKL